MTRIMIYITCYSSIRKGLNRKMPKKIMYTHCTLYMFKITGEGEKLGEISNLYLSSISGHSLI